MFKSLPVRLLLIFVIGFIVLLSVLHIGVEYSLKSKINTLQAGSLMRMTRIILDRETNQIDINRATHVAERTGIRIHIHTEQETWSSENSTLKTENFEFKPVELQPFQRGKKHRHKPPKMELAKGFKFNVYKVTTRHGTLFYEIDNPRWEFDLYWVLIAGLFILCLYVAIRYLFAPIADIKQVVQQVSKGNFKARTGTKRRDDLGELADQVDSMAGELDRLIESKHSLLLSISHELRTPITRAKISSNLLKQDKHSASVLEDLSEMETIITELIETEKLSQASPLARQVTDINALIEEVLAESFKGNTVDFRGLKDSPYVNIDPIRVKLLVRNIVKNAIQYSIESKLAPKIQLDLDDQFLSIHVIDKGLGMPENLLERLTEPFYRLDQSRQRETGGFGLGLYLCQAIVRAHRGELKIYSEEGEGTEVTATLSLEET